MKIKPKNGLKIRDPKTKIHLPVEGRDVPKNGYWLRRLNDGDVELIEEKVISEKPKKKKKKKEKTELIESKGE